MPEYLDRSTDKGNSLLDFNGATAAGESFNPASIVHCRYFFKAAAADANGNIVIKFGKEIKTYAMTGRTVEGFVKNLLRNPSQNGDTITNPPEVWKVDQTPFDFGVAEQCFVVIELEQNNNWMFSQTSIAIDRKESNNFDNDNRDLKHVHPTSGLGSDTPIDKAECRIVYFSVLRRDDKGPRMFKFNVRFIDRPAGTASEIIIDPDIPNTGASPFPPPGGGPAII